MWRFRFCFQKQFLPEKWKGIQRNINASRWICKRCRHSQSVSPWFHPPTSSIYIILPTHCTSCMAFLHVPYTVYSHYRAYNIQVFRWPVVLNELSLECTLSFPSMKRPWVLQLTKKHKPRWGELDSFHHKLIEREKLYIHFGHMTN